MTGIWRQGIWLEHLPRCHIRDLRVGVAQLQGVSATACPPQAYQSRCICARLVRYTWTLPARSQLLGLSNAGFGLSEAIQLNGQVNAAATCQAEAPCLFWLFAVSFLPSCVLQAFVARRCSWKLPSCIRCMRAVPSQHASAGSAVTKQNTAESQLALELHSHAA